jgi:GH15 family glucan-1,4-alpha-glucosidase
MEEYIHYITNIAVEAERPLKPVYGIVPAEPLEERIAGDLAGFQGCGPVRVGNQAAEQLQHDAYGSVILGASQMFIDERLPRMGDADLFRRLEPLGTRARRFALEPDAGPWEYRGRQRVHTHSATMCWVACDRLARIAQRLGSSERAAAWRAHAEALRTEILARAWNEARGAIVGALDGSELDASVLLLPELGLLPAGDRRFVATCDLIGKELGRNGFIMRYTAEDDFGLPETAFLVCQFWYIDALGSIGRWEEARALFADLLKRRNRFGLLSEDIHPVTGELWGNLPQTYSMAGIVNTGRVLSRSWQEAWAQT